MNIWAMSWRVSQRFKVEAKRSDKKFPLDPIQICQKIGGDLDDKYENLIPDMHNPELRVNIEVRDKAAYVHGRQNAGSWRHAGRHQRQGGSAAVRRYRLSGSPVI